MAPPLRADALQLISDNGSTDATQAYGQHLQSMDSRVTYLRHPTNRGLTANHNAVRAVNDHDLYLVIGDDDWLEQEYVSRCVEALQTNPDCALVAGRPIVHDHDETLEEAFENILDERWTDRVTHYYATVQENHFYHGVMRRQALAAVPPMPHALAANWHFLASCAALGKFLTLESTAVHMTRGGTSSAGSTERDRFTAMVRSLGLPKSHVSLPWVRICLAAIGDVLYANRVFRTKPLAERVILSARIAAIFNRCFFYPRILRYGGIWTKRFLPRPVFVLLHKIIVEPLHWDAEEHR